MTHTLSELATISDDTLADVIGGRNPAGGLPMKVMSVLDKPQKSFDAVKDALGMHPSGRPGQQYNPATSNGDGTINAPSFTNPNSGAHQVPRSQ